MNNSISHMYCPVFILNNNGCLENQFHWLGYLSLNLSPSSSLSLPPLSPYPSFSLSFRMQWQSVLWQQHWWMCVGVSLWFHWKHIHMAMCEWWENNHNTYEYLMLLNNLPFMFILKIHTMTMQTSTRLSTISLVVLMPPLVPNWAPLGLACPCH